MKKLFFILIIIANYLPALAQSSVGNDSTRYIRYAYNYGTRQPRAWFDSVLVIPRDTAYSKSGVAIKGISLYYGDGSKWVPISGGSGGGGTDNASFHKAIASADSTKQIFTKPNGDTVNYVFDGNVGGGGGGGSGTVTNVSPITLGTTGTDLTSTVANPTTAAVITLNVPNASAANRGVLLAADWITFNSKENGLGNPSTNGYILSSTTGGVRSWIVPPAGGSGTVTGGTITWPGTIYTTPTTGVVTSGNLAFSPTLANQGAYTLIGNNTAGVTTPTSFTNPYISGIRRNTGATAVEANLNGTWITQFQDSTGGAAGWRVNGNTGTDTSINFLGTTDNNSLLFRVNNIRAGLISADSATGNISYGFKSLLKNVPRDSGAFFIGKSNLAIGSTSLINLYSRYANVAGNASYNIGVGSNSLYNATTAIGNVAIGVNSLFSTISSGYNVAIGHRASELATTVSGNIGIGAFALQSTTTGGNNVAIGYSALQANTTFLGNTAIGNGAMISAQQNYNTAVGSAALSLLVGGYQNTAVGASSGGTGSESTYFGFNAGAANTGNFNTNIGSRARGNATSGDANVALGYYAGNYTNTLSNTLWIANSATNNLLFGNFSTGQVKINAGSSPTLTTSAAFEVASTTQGVLMPSMTTTQRNAIASPANGLQVYDTSINKMCFYNGTSWQQVTTTAAP